MAGLGYLAGVRWTNSPATAVQVARLTDFLGLEEYPAISPDGRSVAFTADEGGTRAIWVKLTAGGAPLQLTRDRDGSLAAALVTRFKFDIVLFATSQRRAIGDAVGSSLPSAAPRAALLTASRMATSATTARDSPSFGRQTADSSW